MVDMIGKLDPKDLLGIDQNSVLEMYPGYTMVKPPEVIGHDSVGLIVKWFYKEFTLTLEYAESTADGAFPLASYAVQKVEMITGEVRCP